MSWSASYIHDGSDADITLSNVKNNEFHEDQFHQAVGAVENLIASGVLGSPDKKYRVNLSGHSNPNHEPAGWMG